MKLGSYLKLDVRYSRPFEILDRIGLIAYEIAFPSSVKYHNVFRIYLLKKYVHDPNLVIDWDFIQVKLEGYIEV